MKPRTIEGLLLEHIMRSTENAYLLCWNGANEETWGPVFVQSFDCACAITFPDTEMWSTCGCICHERIELMCSSPHIRLWLRAMKMAEFDSEVKILPPFPKDHAEKVNLGKELYNKHWGNRSLAMGPCLCDHCNYVRKMDPEWAREKDEMAEAHRQDAIARLAAARAALGEDDAGRS